MNNAALLIISHSAKLAAGVVELAEQMAPQVPLRAVGGRHDGQLGTDYDQIETTLQELLEAGHQVGILTDLGSATMSVESILEYIDGPARILPGPIAEGTIAAAVAAAQGADLDGLQTAVRQAAQSQTTNTANAIETEPAGQRPRGPREATTLANPEQPSHANHPIATRTIVVGQADGLHARPAALIARMIANYDASVTINGAPANSLLELLGLNVRHGDTITVTGNGTQADAAVNAVATALQGNTIETTSENH